ncbi:MAG TPA: hypothetical protein VHD87_16030 [Acidimicrobiales bacterium]|nr:hypothetical protein [Acidimicrobiales bacterium]
MADDAVRAEPAKMNGVDEAKRIRIERVITVAVLVAAVGFTFAHLHPNLLFTNTTTAGGDMGAHVWTPAYLRDHLLPHGRLTGWAPDWYGGFPALTFYFPLPSLLIVLADLVMPYNIAFKLVSVSGLLTLPLAVWFFAKSLRLRFPGPALIALATVPFMFDRTFTIYGGNIASTLAGEFAMSISLSFCLVFLGLFNRVLETGKHKALCALMLACTGLSHIVPSIIAVFGALVLLALRPQKSSVKRAAPVFVVGGLLAGFWVIPFLLRLPYTNDMGWEKLLDYRHQLFPHQGRVLFVMAAIGAVLAVVRWSKFGMWATAMAGLSALGFIYAPQSRLWNARLLPSWFFCLYLLAGVAGAEIALGASELLGGIKRAVIGGTADADAERFQWLPLVAVPLVAGAYVFTTVGMSLGALPSWSPWKTSDRNFVLDWGAWNYSGYERKPSYPEYHDVVTTMQRMGQQHGCGRAMWEYEPELDRLGTPMALMLLPYWTHDCIQSMEGLFFESAASTPYHFLNQSELSARPSRPQRDLHYEDLNVDVGVKHLQEIGVKYYMAISAAAQAQADVDPDLQLIATTGKWSATINDNGSSTVDNRAWKIYLVKDAAMVTPLANYPAVMTKVPKGGPKWLAAAEDAYLAPQPHEVLYAASGPKSWPRVARPSQNPPTKPVRGTTKVSHIHTSDDRISFDVTKLGVPVEVKASYFPNWQASGAQGPWRVTPNEMVVIPTSTHVSLHYGWTAVDWIGNAATLLGLLGLIVLWRWSPSGDGAEDESRPPTVEEVAPSHDDDAWLKELAGVGPPT